MKRWILLLLALSALTYQAYATTDLNKQCPGLTGNVVYRNDATYDHDRLVSNYYTSKDKFPKAIVYCQSPQDVQNAIKWARCTNTPIRVRSGGHNHEGYSTGSDVIVIDVSKMKQFNFDKQHLTATIQSGMTGGELYSKLYQLGYTQAGGTCSDVGVSGLMLTGGMGPLFRKQGLFCDSLVSLDMVDARGQLLHVTKNNENKDLFWASCGGGGGNFGVVTNMTIKVYPAETVTWFNIGWDWNQPIAKVITEWQTLFGTNNPIWFSHIDLWSKAFPSAKFNKMPIKVLGVYYGTPEQAKKQLEPLLKIGHPNSQVVSQVTWDKAIKEFEESTSVFVTSKPEYKSSGAYVMQNMPAEAINNIVNRLQNTKSPLMNVLMFSLGGAGGAISPTQTAYYYRKAKFFIVYANQWLQQKDAASSINEIDSLRQSLLSVSEGDYIGNPDRELTDYMTSYYGQNAAKLGCIKGKYDPDNVFHFEQSIPPATTACH